MREVVKNELIKLGYSLSNIGTLYLIDCILLIYESDDYLRMISNLNKNVYKIIAKRYNANLSTFKSNISKATDSMLKKMYLRKPSARNMKISPKVIISEVLYKITNGKYI